MTSDTHFCHENIIDYEDRPFEDVEEMNESLIKSWNQVVREHDLVLHLGDVFFCSTDKQFEIMDRLNGDIMLIRGNHDSQTEIKLVERLGFVGVYDELLLGDYMFTHRPLANKDLEGTRLFNIHGHTHSLREDDEKHMCVSVEKTDYRPIHFTRIKNIRSGNFDKVN